MTTALCQWTQYEAWSVFVFCAKGYDFSVFRCVVPYTVLPTPQVLLSNQPAKHPQLRSGWSDVEECSFLYSSIIFTWPALNSRYHFSSCCLIIIIWTINILQFMINFIKKVVRFAHKSRITVRISSCIHSHSHFQCVIQDL